MFDASRFYINGNWVAPLGERRLPVINPANEAVQGQVVLGNAADVDCAVQAARTAFPAFAATSRQTRLELLARIAEVYQTRQADLAQAICSEMGAPLARLAVPLQTATGLGHFHATATALSDFAFERPLGSTRLLYEPIGVAALITPWNWPANQIACKVAPALAAGCTMVLKPSELAPFSARVLAEIFAEAGVPPGVFNLVHGDGAGVGAALTAHPEVDMVSFTGSNAAGVQVTQNAAATVKRVALELGGKSANLILDDADFPRAIRHAVNALMLNSGQSCNAPSRLIVPAARLAEVEALVVAAVAKLCVGDPLAADSLLGPVANRAQFERVQGYIALGLAEGARLLCGGPGRPPGLTQGYYVQPTVFTGVSNQMRIAREEIFGPVLCILPVADDDAAVAVANDSPYGLSGYVSSGDLQRARRVARRLRTGNVHLNAAPPDFLAPFGGYRQSGNGREWGAHGIAEFLETKAIIGYGADSGDVA